ncbi:hypothetical protein INT47_013038 [Mucor saturninus]|uniref:Uncharacterized protein n=1 Tax=Mucor saturninus TaxID=64648 RepID=A0A8H7QYP4_9FUNG|nr:hypothetical protein INT47_013038 [Mucor saturninus]
MTTKKCLKMQLKKRTTEAELSILEGSLSSSNSVGEAPSFTQISQFNSLIPAIYSDWACREIVVEVVNRI